MVTTEVLCSRIVNDIGTQLEGPREVGTHHRIVNNDDRILFVPPHELTDRLDVGDLKERVRGSFEEDHCDFLVRVLQDGEERGRVRRIYVVSRDPVVFLQVPDQPVRSSVEIVSGDNVVSRFQESENDIEGAHAGSDGERVSCRRDLGNVVFCNRDRR